MKDFIVDQETGANIAFIVDGEIFQEIRYYPKIATIRDGTVYDLEGNLVGHLKNGHVTGLITAEMPVSFRNLLTRSSN
jgi:hypothetical protein